MKSHTGDFDPSLKELEAIQNKRWRLSLVLLYACGALLLLTAWLAWPLDKISDLQFIIWILISVACFVFLYPSQPPRYTLVSWGLCFSLTTILGIALTSFIGTLAGIVGHIIGPIVGYILSIWLLCPIGLIDERILQAETRNV